MPRRLLPSLLVLAVAPSVFALDYPVRPVPPEMTRDAATSVLLDVQSKTPGADGVRLDASARTDAGGYRAAAIVPGRALGRNAWTVEMVLQIPADADLQTDIDLGGWRGKDYEVRFTLSRGIGATLRVYSWDRAAEFLVQPYAGGNGCTVQGNARGQCVYVVFGVDLAAQRAAAIVRDLDGNVLLKNMNFAGGARSDSQMVADQPPEQRRAELARRWKAMAERFAGNLPETFPVGGPGVELQRLRISRCYRENVLEVAPLFAAPGVRTWTPQALDPRRSETKTVERSVGYPGYRNERTVTTDETLLRLAPGSPPVTLALPGLPVGLYSFYVYGAVDAKGRDQLERVWRPCPMEFTATGPDGERVESGRLLLKQDLRPRRMQGFHLHADKPGDYTLAFSVPPQALETPLIQRIELLDQLAGLPDEAVKRSQNVSRGPAVPLQTLSDERRRRDADIWAALPPLNLHLQVHSQVKQFQAPPPGVALPPWQLRAYLGQPSHYHIRHALTPLDMINPQSQQVLSHDAVVRGVPWPGQWADDGTGIFFSREKYPGLPHSGYVTPRAEILGGRVRQFVGLLGAWDYRDASLARKYFETGDPNVGHDAALALVRLAYDWPALEMNLHEIRLCTHSPDFEFERDWSASRNGKYFYEGWSGDMAVCFLNAYDQLFPYIDGNQVFADAVHRFLPWVKTPQDVIRFLDRRLVFASVRDFNKGLIRAAPVEDFAAQVLGPGPLTAPFFDLTRQHAEIYPFLGTYQELYATALSRSGSYHIGAFMVYALGSAQDLIAKAYMHKMARQQNVPLRMDLSDIARYPKVRAAGDFLIEMWPAGGFPFMIGDASGGPHTGLEASKRLTMARDSLEKAFALYGDPRHAALLKELCGSQDPAVLRAAEGVPNPILHAPSRVIPDYGAIIEQGVEETDPAKKTAMTLRLGIGQGHAHSDFLDLNFFALGLPVAVDLACRSEGANWSRPSASWSFLHNHAIAHDSEDPKGAGGQTGEPWLSIFAPPLVRASYTDAPGAVRLDRDAILMSVGDTGVCYALDVQRLRGGKLHTWCFHGCESDELELNTPLQANTVRWIDRTLEGTHKTGKAPDTLQATWTMTRAGREIPHSFTGGGVIQTVGCEPAVLGERYDPARPPVHVRATLLGCGGHAVLQGNPYSQAYAYAFPFLWVQRDAGPAASVYPAVYEWYRGATPVVRTVELAGKDPLQVVVTTTSGQQDTYAVTSESFAVVSRDEAGVRYAKLSGLAQFTGGDLIVQAAPAVYSARITDIDYAVRRLKTDRPLPADAVVAVGNPGRRSVLDLKGKDQEFTWDDDLLIHEGRIEELKITGPETIRVTTNQRLFQENAGNRRLSGLTQVSEDFAWHFRDGQVIRRPPGATLTERSLADANGDGLVHLKSYEIGIGDEIRLPADVELRRARGGLEVKTNVTATISLRGRAAPFAPSPDWQPLN